MSDALASVLAIAAWFGIVIALICGTLIGIILLWKDEWKP